MRKLLLRALVLGALVLPVAPNPADAATSVAGSGAFSGSGTVSNTVTTPPFTATSATSITGSLTGALTINGTNVVMLASSCSFNGTSTETLATGNGTLAGNCSGTATVTPPGATATFSLNCVLDYTRIVTSVWVSLYCTGSVSVTPTSFCGNGLMQWVPTDGDNFLVAGQMTYRPVDGAGCV